MISQTQRIWSGPDYDDQGKQTDKGGDCFAACIASILELNIEDVPNYLSGTEQETWWDRWQYWLYDNYRMEMIHWEKDWPDPYLFGWWMGNVMYDDTRHSVVFYRKKFMWDPAPEEHKRIFTMKDVLDVTAIFSIATIFDREPGRYTPILEET